MMDALTTLGPGGNDSWFEMILDLWSLMRLDDFRPCHFDHVRPFKTVIIDLFGFQGVMSTILDPGTFYSLSFLILDPILDLWKRSEIKFLGYLCSSWEDAYSMLWPSTFIILVTEQEAETPTRFVFPWPSPSLSIGTSPDPSDIMLVLLRAKYLSDGKQGNYIYVYISVVEEIFSSNSFEDMLKSIFSSHVL